MLFLDSPSQLAPASAWQDYLVRLALLNQHDRTVVQEKARAERMITLLLAEEALDRQAAAPPPSL
jgi:hypothetical protein